MRNPPPGFTPTISSAPLKGLCSVSSAGNSALSCARPSSLTLSSVAKADAGRATRFRYAAATSGDADRMSKLVSRTEMVFCCARGRSPNTPPASTTTAVTNNGKRKREKKGVGCMSITSSESATSHGIPPDEASGPRADRALRRRG